MSEDNVVKMRTRRSLSAKESYQLTQLILDEYTSSGMSFVDFAKHAATKLGFDVVWTNIQSRCEEFEIKSNTKLPKPKEDPSAYTAMLLKHEMQINDLIEQMAKITAWINDTFPSVKGKMFK